jgi:hypothetical protein
LAPGTRHWIQYPLKWIYTLSIRKPRYGIALTKNFPDPLVSSPHLAASEVGNLEEGLSFDEGTWRVSVSARLVSAATISTYTDHPRSEQNFSNAMSVYAAQMGWDAVTYMIKEFWPDLRKKSAKNNH